MPHPPALGTLRDRHPGLAAWANCGAPPRRSGQAGAWEKDVDRSLEKLRIVHAEEFLEGGGSALLQGVDSLDQAENVGSHYQKVAEAAGACVPVGVRRPAGDEDGGTGVGFEFVFAGLYAENPFQDVPSFVIIVVKVTRSDEPRRFRRTAGVLPFGDDERIVWRA